MLFIYAKISYVKKTYLFDSVIIVKESGLYYSPSPESIRGGCGKGVSEMVAETYTCTLSKPFLR